ncbi:MAG: plastocyanin/azurin family copper-binding protein [Nitrosopumilus sp.]|nr:plastocyanin/azurin family copper-binding protein [Nitrosopumilus sp.]
MKNTTKVASVLVIVLSISLVSISVNFASAQSVPDWIKNTALWYGEGIVSEGEFLNMIKFLIEEGIIVIETGDEVQSIASTFEVIIPNGNSELSSQGSYFPLNAEVSKGTTVTWKNDDERQHIIISIDEKGEINDEFASPALNTGDRYEYTFEEEGVYNYFCSFHPWRVGVVTVS